MQLARCSRSPAGVRRKTIYPAHGIGKVFICQRLLALWNEVRPISASRQRQRPARELRRVSCLRETRFAITLHVPFDLPQNVASAILAIYARIARCARQLTASRGFSLLFNTLGTPPISAIHKYMNQKHVPQLFVATGASKWGNPKEFPWTMGWQPDHMTEAIIYAKHILANVKDPKIAILMQNDDYGKDYLTGFKQGLGTDATESHSSQPMRWPIRQSRARSSS
jgi:hypothetical protein